MKTREEVEQLKREWVNDPCWDVENIDGFEEWRRELTEFRMAKEQEWKAKRDALPLNRAKMIMDLFPANSESKANTLALIALVEEVRLLRISLEEFVIRH